MTSLYSHRRRTDGHVENGYTGDKGLAGKLGPELSHTNDNAQ